MKNLKKKLHDGEASIGCLLNLGSSLIAEIIGQAGFDWAMIDLEHGAGNEKDAFSQILALRSNLTSAIVRVENNDKIRIQRALDMGAEGVVIPQIESPTEVKKAIDGIYYQPHGKRGVSKMVRAASFGKDFDTYFKQSKDNILCAIQIETNEILNHLEEVAALDGVDVLFIGPLDLTMSLGVSGEFEHPKYVQAVKAIIDAAHKAEKKVGIYLLDPEEYKTYYDMGVRLFLCGSDGGFVAEGAKHMIINLNSKRN